MLGAGSIPFRAIANQKAVRDEGVIYVVGHLLLNQRCHHHHHVFSLNSVKTQRVQYLKVCED